MNDADKKLYIDENKQQRMANDLIDASNTLINAPITYIYGPEYYSKYEVLLTPSATIYPPQHKEISRARHLAALKWSEDLIAGRLPPDDTLITDH